MLDKNEVMKSVNATTQVDDFYSVCKNIFEKEGCIVEVKELQFSIKSDAKKYCSSWIHFGHENLDQLKDFVERVLDELC